MTPERLTALAALLLEVRDWLDDEDPGCFDARFVEHMVNLLGAIRRRLVEAGAS